MARIRSIHPGMRKDEAFMVMSFMARDALGGVWMEADDWGAFQWKPLTLKANIFPADNLDMDAVLAELVANDWVKQVEIGGKNYGLCRNFCKWQRPKKPNLVHFIPPEFRTYVAYRAHEDHKLPDAPTGYRASVPNQTPTGSPPVPHQDGTSGESSPQMEDGGCRMEDVTPKAPKGVSYSKDFETWWETYPHKVAKDAGYRAWQKAIKRVDLQTLIEAAKQYIARKPAEIAYANPATWLNGGRWMDAPAGGASSAPDGPMLPSDWTAEDARWLTRLQGVAWHENLWGPKDIKDPGCRIPRHVWTHHLAADIASPPFMVAAPKTTADFDAARDMPTWMRRKVGAV